MRALLLIVIVCVGLFASAALAEETAAELEAHGIAALKLSQSEPDAIIAAAISFGKASVAYEQANDDGKATEMNSFLYWCKKKMTLQQMDAFLKGGDAAVAIAKRMKAMESAAPADDAQIYYARAESYATAHEGEHLLIAVRFFEVADRFLGTEVSVKAQRRSLDEMQLVAQNNVPAAPRREEPHVDTAAKAPVPDAAKLKVAEATVRDLFKAELAKTAAADKLALSKKLVEQANETNDDPAARYVLLTTAANLAAQGQSLDELNAALDDLASKYDGDATAIKRTDLGVLISATRDAALSKLAIAYKTLLDKPEDAAANLIVGKHLAFVKGEYEQGLAMLAKSSHAELAKIAKQDLTNPDQGAGQISVGDLWWDLAVKTPEKDDKGNYYSRARYWYEKALPTVSGLSKTKLEKRIETVDAVPQSATTPAASIGNLKGQLVLDLGKGVKLELALIPSGTFVMGSPLGETDRQGNERQHSVTISKPLYMGVYAVTQEQFELIAGDIPSDFRGPRNPVDKASWEDAKGFCDKLNEVLTGKLPPGSKVELPTEAQWEYACRAGTKTRFYSGDRDSDLDSVGWHSKNADGRAHQVGEKRANAWGLFDMHGNVWQWCRDWMGPYRAGSQTDPPGPDDGTNRVVRGGNFDAVPLQCKSAYRHDAPPNGRYAGVGFRVVVDFPTKVGSNVTSIAPAVGTNSKSVISLDLGGGLTLELALIPGGSFVMGSPASEKERGDERQHAVMISKPFYMGKYTVTQEQYDAVMGVNPSFYKSAKNPVEPVPWEDAQKFCELLDDKVKGHLPVGLKIQLPTEAQWEYACRAGTKTRFYSGDNEIALDAAGWFSDNSGGKPHAVGLKKPNAWGLYDMHGNVWQWCRDWKDDYPIGAQTDPKGPPAGVVHVLRGGSWSSIARSCRSACRSYSPARGDIDFGFRIVAAVPVGKAP